MEGLSESNVPVASKQKLSTVKNSKRQRFAKKLTAFSH